MKALEILQRNLANMSIANPMEKLSISGYEVIAAIAELEALQEPKTCDGCVHDGKHIALHPCSSCTRGAAVDFYQAYPSKGEEFRDNM